MIRWLRGWLDGLTGSGEAALAVPPMDGALKPNRLLDTAAGSLAVAEPDNLVRWGERLLFSSGTSLVALEDAGGERRALPLERFETEIAALAAREDSLAIVLDSGEILLRGGRHDGRRLSGLGEGQPLRPTAVCFADADHLLLCSGSSRAAAEGWQQDLLERGASGSVWRIGLADGKAQRLAGNLAYPYGILPVEGGTQAIVSESWRHRLVRLDARAPSRPQPVLSELPGYPARLCEDGAGGYWLTIFAPRNQLVEFVMREPAYRARMIERLPRDYWIAPKLRSRQSFLAPLQGGAVRQMGQLKPWAPTFSYGLVVGLDPDLQPRRSLHSRADGSRHGITSCLAQGERLLIASKGGNEILFHDPQGAP